MGKTGREIKKTDVAEPRIKSACGIFSLQNNIVTLTSVPGLSRTVVKLPESLNAEKILTGTKTFACILTKDNQCFTVSIPTGQILCKIELKDDIPVTGQAIDSTLILFGKKGNAAAFTIIP